MKTQKLVRHAMTLVVFIVTVVAGLVVASMILRYMFGPVVVKPETARAEAIQLIARVGGIAKVCEEASQIFKRFGVSKWYSLNSRETKDYPAIAALTNAGWRGIEIEPYSPAFIQISVGNHQRNYVIIIFESDDEKSVFTRDALRLEDSCIFVVS